MDDAEDTSREGWFISSRGLGRIRADGRIVWDPRYRGSGRKLYRVREPPPKKRGRPPHGGEWRKDQIVGYVHHLQKLEPDRQLESIVQDVVDYCGVSRQTVFVALREHNPGKPICVGVGNRLHPVDGQ
jgi:hypothetical protein